MEAGDNVVFGVGVGCAECWRWCCCLLEPQWGKSLLRAVPFMHEIIPQINLCTCIQTRTRTSRVLGRPSHLKPRLHLNTASWSEEITSAMATIKAIESRSIHQIQSGQVIVDLTSVVKELVENSLDAGATSIEIRFRNQGLDSIEVLDNGKGIPPEDFETIALKHYTSKLSSYEDLTGLETFGFRGEALSSLCALSKFHIVTARSEDGAVGKKLEFETSGKLKGTSVVAAQRGTTVSVENLFCNLPVRRKELEKNIKREYAKVIGHLHAYACVSVGVRFAVSNQMPKGKKVALFSTNSNTTTKENITNVFGAKTLLALVKLDLRLEMQPSTGPSTQGARNWSTQAIDRSMEVQVQGHISKPVFGEGRQAPDRQMFFVNSRPCGLPQVSKAFNEVYKSFNVSQSPFIFANLIMDTNAYDVNVSPDKRSIMLHDQTALLESLKSALTDLFEKTDHTVPQSQLPGKKLPAFQTLSVTRQDSGEDSAAAADEQPSEEEEGEDESEEEDVTPARKNGTVNGTPQSLIQSWIGRDTEARSETPVPKKNSDLSKDKRKLIDSMKGKDESEINVQLASPGRNHQPPLASASGQLIRRTSEGSGPKPEHETEQVCRPDEEGTAAPDLPPDPLGSPYDDLFSQRRASLPRPVQDFNALMDRSQAPKAGDTGADLPAARRPPIVEESEDESEEEDTSLPKEPAETTSTIQAQARLPSPSEPKIPAVAPSSQKATPGPVQNAFDRMRPKRTPLQTAEITIGNQTTTTVIGSDSPFKRRKIHRPDDSQAIAKFGGSPSVARGLRSFAAPGSQLLMDSSQVLGRRDPSPGVEDEDEDQDEDVTPSQTGVSANEHPKRPAGGMNGDARHEPQLRSDALTSDALDELQPAPADDDEYDGDYVNEEEKKIQEDEKVARLIYEAEQAAAQPTEENLRRASQLLKNGGSRKEATLQLACDVDMSVEEVAKRGEWALSGVQDATTDLRGSKSLVKNELDDTEAESRLSLTVSKADFDRMHIIGQFNLGFILAVRPANGEQDEDELFIIDQHAADEKYNYERFQRTVTLQNQRLVRPKPLELTAIEEEIILNNSDALKANGFEIEMSSSLDSDDPDNDPTAASTKRQARLLTLPMSGNQTFNPADLSELLYLLSETPPGSTTIPRPKKVQKILAMRACRSSIMVGKTLTGTQMRGVVRHMGEMEKPWNCPHGRPTMRHLAGLDGWRGWAEGDSLGGGEGEWAEPGGGEGGKTNWKEWLAQQQ